MSALDFALVLLAVALLGGIGGFYAGMTHIVHKQNRESRELDRFIVMEDYRIESGAKDGDLIQFECEKRHRASGMLKQFDSMPRCPICGLYMEPVSFSTTVAEATSKEV